MFVPGRPDAERQLSRRRRWAAGAMPGKNGTEERAGAISEDEWAEMEAGMTRSRRLQDHGHGRQGDVGGRGPGDGPAGRPVDPGNGFRPYAHELGLAGRQIVEMVWEDLSPSRFSRAASFDNGVVAWMAMGGSTNAVCTCSPWRAAQGSR